MSLSERVQQVNGEISATVERAVERAVNELREAVSRRLHANSEEIQRQIGELAPVLPASYLSPEAFAQDFAQDLAHTEHTAGTSARRDAQRGLRDSVAALDRARSQADILAVLLKESAHHASRAALLLIRGGELRGWGSEGFGEAGEAIRNLTLTPQTPQASQDNGWGRLLAGEAAVRLAAGDCADLCSRVESPLPQEGVLVPLVLRDRLAAALYADRTGDSGLAAEALQVLAYVASQAIETLPFRERAATSTLTLTGEEIPAAQSSAPVAPASAPEPPAVPQAEVTAVEALAADVTEVEAEPEYAVSAPWTAEDEQSAVAAEPEPAEEAPAVPDTPVDPWEASPRYTEELQVASIAAAAAAGANTAAAEPDEAPRYPRSVEPEATAPVRFPDPSPEATVLLQRSAVQQAAEAADAAAAAPPPAAQPLRPVPVPPMPTSSTTPGIPGAGDEPAPALPGTPEVRPPSGVDGPGWAFATTRVPVSPSDETMHEEARRLARLLVSEIKLYNEEQVEEGRRNRDVYERLKEDIDRSRQMYEERVDPRILRSTDYFYQELVRILAAGDSRALGI